MGILCRLSNASPAVGFSGSNFSFNPRSPHASDAARARYGFVAAPGILFSILLESGEDVGTLKATVLFSIPQWVLIGAEASMTNRLY